MLTWSPDSGRRVGERLADAVAQPVRGEAAGVDDQIGVTAQALHHEAFLADALDDAVGGRQGMTPTGGFVPVDQVVVGGLEEDDAVVDVFLLELLERLGEFAEEHAAAGVHHDGDPGGASGARHQLRHLAEQRGRQVVDHEEPEILQGVGGLGPTRPGQPGDQGEAGGGARALPRRHRQDRGVGHVRRSPCCRPARRRASLPGPHGRGMHAGRRRPRGPPRARCPGWRRSLRPRRHAAGSTNRTA